MEELGRRGKSLGCGWRVMGGNQGSKTEDGSVENWEDLVPEAWVGG